MRAGRHPGRARAALLALALLAAAAVNVTAPGGVADAATPPNAYVVNFGSDTVTPFDTATNTAGTPINVGGNPEDIAITPNGATAYVANGDNGTGTDGTVTPISTATNAPGTPVSVGDNPLGIAVSPDGTTAYVTNGGSPAGGSDTATPIDTATNTPGSKITVGNTPDGIAIQPGWTQQATQPQAATTAGPAAAYSQGDLYVAWKGATTDHVGYAAYNGSTWAPQQNVSGSWGTALTTNIPALAVYNGDLYAAWTGQASNDIYYSAYNGTTWTAQQTISGSWGSAGTNAGPALMVFDGDLYAGWRGTTSGHVYYSAYNGTTWAPQVALSPTSADASSAGRRPDRWRAVDHRLDHEQRRDRLHLLPRDRGGGLQRAGQHPPRGGHQHLPRAGVHGRRHGHPLRRLEGCDQQPDRLRGVLRQCGLHSPGA
jgi:YVTN family beta-propeller protein